MKGKHIISRLLPLLALLSGCGFLDEEPKDQLPREDLLGSDRGMYLATLGNLYSMIGSSQAGEGLAGTYRGVYDLNTFTSDEAILPTRSSDWYDGGLWQRLHMHAWETGEAPLKNAWNYLYKVIVMANQAIEDLKDYPQWRQEARAVRALYYYYLLDLFGRVPLVQAADVSMDKVAQSSRPDVFRFVFFELNDVLDDLSGERSNIPGSYYGRVTQPVALFLLAKLALNAPVWLVDDWTKDPPLGGADFTAEAEGRRLNAWELVEYYCGRLALPYGLDLEEQYGTNFSVHNESSVENIFTIPMDKLTCANQFQYVFRSLHYDHAAAIGYCGENGASATLEALAANGYGTEDQDPRFVLNYWAGQPWDLNGDGILLPDGTPLEYRPEKVALDVSGLSEEKTAGARMKKYEPDPGGMKDGKLVDNDIVLFRYADVLLMLSEARLRAGKPMEEVLEPFNRVRERAGADPLDTVTLDDLLAERMREFAWEGWRRQDLIRFGKFTDKWSSHPVLPGEESGYTTVFPIPADVLDLNPLLKQNPGY